MQDGEEGLLNYTVTVTPHAEGGYEATCAELPWFTAYGADPEACNMDIMEALVQAAGDSLGDVISLGWELRIKVSYLDVPQDVADTYDWQLIMPKHDH